MAFEPKEPQKEIKYQEARIYSDAELHNYTEEELKKFKIKHSTPMCDDLEKGPWPSFVADTKRLALHRRKLADNRMLIDRDVAEDLLGQLELSYEHGETHWKHGGIVGVFGYGGGLSEDTQTFRINFRPLPISTPSGSISREAIFTTQTISEPCVISGSTGEAG